jgi:hypothetical protein
MTNAKKIDDAVSAHTYYFIKLRVAISEGISQFKPEIIRTDNSCDFGRWLYGEFPKEAVGASLYVEIKELHAQFHREAARILELAIAGRKDEALALLEDHSEIRKCSTVLLAKLNELKDMC